MRSEGREIRLHRRFRNILEPGRVPAGRVVFIDHQGPDPFEEVVGQRGMLDVVPAVRAVAIDHAGRLWVQRWSAQSPAPVDIFLGTGEYRGTVYLDRFPAVFIGSDRIGVPLEEEDGTVVLQIYRVITNARMPADPGR